ncbi:MAG: HAD-IIIA family hydrolase [Hyphomicrobiaceae bacterium]
MLNQAAILVGGLGTRLGERTRSTPKPLLDVGGRPFLEHLLDEVTRYPGITSIVLLAGYKAGQVAEFYADRTWRGARISVVTEPTPLGTGGALKFAADVLEPRFLLLNGDSYFDFNFLDLVVDAGRNGASLTMALKRDHPGDRYGRVDVDGGRVTRFLPAGPGTSGPINAGVYCAGRGILELIDEAPCSLEQSVFPRLAAAGQLGARLYDGYFIDIGVPTDLERAGADFGSRRRPAVFFDRDGVLNEDKGYVYRREDFAWIDGAAEAVKLCNDLGYYTFVVTNQAGVARGFYSEEDVRRLHAWMNAELARHGAHIDAFQYCPFHEAGVVDAYRRASDRRKPAPGMLLDCVADWPVDTSRSLMVGDKTIDMDAAAAAGITGHLFDGGNLSAFLTPLLSRDGI